MQGMLTKTRGRMRPAIVPRPWEPEVLLVEDDGEMRSMLAAVLRRDGFRVVTARDGAEALTWLGSLAIERPGHSAPDLIVTDQRMPGFDGLTVLEAARAMRLRAPVLVITAFGDSEIHERAASFADAEVLDKPFDMDDLLHRVRRLLGLVA